jgi:DNA-binding CsgD family transcriptional regulator
VALRSEGLVEGLLCGTAENGPHGLAILEEAVTVLESSEAPVELARAITDYGAMLRRAGRRTEARAQLERGLDLAHHWGARRIASRARAELVAAGAKPRRDAMTGRDALTASELRVARLAAAGRTNREIAQSLFITAIGDLETAAGICDQIGAPGFAVEASVELAEALARRGTRADTDRARTLLASAAPDAQRLGMAPFSQRIEGLRARLPAGPPPLSPREREVARLVGRGLTNRQIAAALYVSERTAQNHVQHILTKLGFANRSQIAVWSSASPPPPAE